MKDKTEKWKIIDQYPKYRISSTGRIFSLIRNRMLNPSKKGSAKNGYYLGIKINKKVIKVHRMVALAFCENPLNKKQVNHIDGNKLNNNYENLEWCTNSENQIHAIKIGLKVPVVGEKLNRSNILNSSEVKKVITLHNNGFSDIEISKIIGIARSNIWKIRTGRSWSHLTGIKTKHV